MKISVLISNYNKYKFLKKTLKNIVNQNFNDYEIILFDDQSEDKSVDLIKKYKKIKLIINKKKKIPFSPMLNQINAVYEAFKKSKGDVICLMDADDSFFKNKILNINNFFIKNKDKKFLVNTPETFGTYFKYKNKNSNKHIWPTIFPTSCISARRIFFSKFFKYSMPKRYKNLAIDARLNIFAKYYYNDFNVLQKKLNSYTIDQKGNWSQYNHLSINWWISRNEAFEYLKYILKLRKIRFKKSSDYYLTKFVNLFIF